VKQVIDKLWIGTYDDLINSDKDFIYLGNNKLSLDKLTKGRHIELKDDDSKQAIRILRAVNHIVKHIAYSNNDLLVCCDTGISRSPYVIASYYAYTLAIEINEAYKLLKKHYPEADEQTPLRINDKWINRVVMV